MSILDQLTTVLPTNGINAANFLKVPINAQPVANLSSDQVQGLIAQAQAATGQAANVISDKGIGAYGIQPEQLEKAGFLKPGTVATFLKQGANVTQVLSSPSVWTGKDGIVNKDTLLGDQAKQASITQNIMSLNASSLQKLGVLTGTQSTAEIGALIQTANKFGAALTQSWTKGAAPSQLLAQMNNLGRVGQYAISFVNTKLPSFSTGILSNLNAVNTVDRTAVDQAVKNVLGSDKLPVPNYKQTEAPASPPIASPVSQKELQAAANALVAAQENYDKVLKANGGDRTNPTVAAAFAAYQRAIAELDRLTKLLGL